MFVGIHKKYGERCNRGKKCFLTHSNPDHIGTTAWFRENIGCTIYAGETESFGLTVFLKGESAVSKLEDELQSNADVTFDWKFKNNYL